MPETKDTNFPTGRSPQVFTGFIDRSDTSAKYLFTLPSGCIITLVTVDGYAASDASSAATISVGLENGLCNEILSSYDVKTAGTGAGLTVPNATAGATGSNWSVGSNAMRIAGKYAESGSASAAGGPWQVSITALTI